MLGRLRQIASRRPHEVDPAAPTAAEATTPPPGHSRLPHPFLRRRRHAAAPPASTIQHPDAAAWQHRHVEPGLLGTDSPGLRLSPTCADDCREIADLLRAEPRTPDALDQAMRGMFARFQAALAHPDLPDATRLAFEIDDGRKAWQAFGEDLARHHLDLAAQPDARQLEQDFLRHFDMAVASTRTAIAARNPDGRIEAISVDGRVYKRVAEPVSSGGFGSVARFRHRQDGTIRDVVLKVPHRGRTSPPGRARLFDLPSNEARRTIAAMGTSGDELVTPLLGTLRTRGEGLMLISRHAAFGELRGVTATLQRAHPSAQDQALFTMTLARDVLMGARRLEHKGVLHLDLRDLNLFVDGEGRCRLGDFGLARAFEPGALIETARHPPANTPYFIEPPELDLGSDLHRGVNAYQAGLVLRQLGPPTPGPMPGVDAEAWRALVDGLTDPDPSRRWTLERAALAFDSATRELQRNSDGIGSVAARRALVRTLEQALPAPRSVDSTTST